MQYSIDKEAQAIFEANKTKGFWEKPSELSSGQLGLDPKVYQRLKKAEKLCLMHSEISEALEGVRKDAKSDKIDGFTAEEEELADLYIRLMDHAGGFNLRLGAAIAAKLEHNAKRPYKHGKQF